QDHRIDLRDSVHSLLEVDITGPPVEGILELAVVAELGEPLVQLVRKRLVDSQPFVTGRLAEERVVKPVEAAELCQWPFVLLDPQLDDRVREFGVAAVSLDDEQRR